MLFILIPTISDIITIMKPSFPLFGVSFLWIYQLPMFQLSKWPLNDIQVKGVSIAWAYPLCHVTNMSILYANSKTLHRLARSLWKNWLLHRFHFSEAIVMNLSEHIEKAIKTSPLCVLYFFRTCNNIVNQLLHPPHLYHYFHQSYALYGEWGFSFQKRQLG